MTIAAAALSVLLMVVTGLVLFRRLARYLYAGEGMPPERDLLLLGILPGLGLVGGLLTYLALLHLLRLWVMAPLALAIVWVWREDARALLGGLQDGIAAGLAQLRRGDLFALIAVAAGCGALLLGLLLSTVPSENVDVWVFHIPLAQSFAAHHGFVYPQIHDLLFYSSNPLLFELLSGAVMLAAPNFVAAGAVNLAILFGLVLLVLSFAKRARDIQFLVLCFVFFHAQNFLREAAEPMIDLPRSCFSAAAFLFAYRYARDFRRFDLVMSALLAGVAVAGKYTELITPLFIVAVLAPFLLARRRWMDLLPAVAILASVAGYWYVKNAVLFGNPIFPFLFGHPGISDQWMVDYFKDLGQPFDPADRVYSTNLLTGRGWHDFAVVLLSHFQPFVPYVLVVLLGLFLPQQRRWILPLWILMFFVFWYAVMFNGIRWAVTGMLLLPATAFIVWAPAADRIAGAWNPGWPTLALGAVAPGLKRIGAPWTALASMALALLLLFGAVQLSRGYGHSFLPGWLSRDLAVALVKPDRMADYMAKTRPGYVIYHYIGEHDLAQVLQPFDNGATFDVSSDNGGRPNIWVLSFRSLPADMAQIDRFVAENHVHYFIDETPVKPVDLERLGPEHVARAKAVIARLMPHSRLVLREQDMALYEILPVPSGR